eukprot:9532965-Prorocentrum_lima.AAC.1
MAQRSRATPSSSATAKRIAQSTSPSIVAGLVGWSLASLLGTVPMPQASLSELGLQVAAF